jgi:uncharacterized protein YdeI (YjbR/CyaY-like superfamily)
MDSKKPVKPQAFSSADKFEKWLKKNYAKSDGIWLLFYKKKSGIKSVTYPEAVDIALCYGWIDSQLKSLDEKSYIQKFTPRRNRSVWSRVNIAKVTQLIKDKRMQPAGLAQINAAKKDGRWEQAYHSSKTAEIPADFLQALNKNKKAKKFFDTDLTKSNKYTIYFMLQSAKRPETKTKRINKIIQMLAKGQKPRLI